MRRKQDEGEGENRVGVCAMKDSVLSKPSGRMPRMPILVGWVALIGSLIWAYGADMAQIVRIWWTEPDYGHCFYVPAFSALLLWLRRDKAKLVIGCGSWWGIPFLLLWAAMWWWSAYFCYQKTIPLSLLPCLAGLALFVGGWQALRWTWPSIVFLFFMIPIPTALSWMLQHPLQRIGTVTSVYILRMLGIPAVAMGNVIRLKTMELGVEEACSGLRMLMVFVAVCVGAAFVLQRPLWQKLIIVASSIPIAVLSNVGRITLTAYLYHLEHTKMAEMLFHNLAGALMVPLAIVLLLAELKILAWFPGSTDRVETAPVAAAAKGCLSTSRVPARLCVMAAAVATVSLVAVQLRGTLDPQRVVMPEWSLHDMPLRLGSWQGSDIQMDPRVFYVIDADVVVDRLYRDREGRCVSMHTAMFTRYNRGVAHNPMLCYRTCGWRLVETSMSPLHLDDGTSASVRFAVWERDGERAVLAFWYQLGDRLVFDRFDLGRARVPFIGQPALPPLIKVLLHMPTIHPREDEAYVRDLGQHVYRWLNHADRRFAPED